MSNEALFLIGDLPGFTPEIGRLVSMMNYVRSTTVSAVRGLGIAELDYQHDAQSNSIAALLLHIAATEVGYQAGTFYGRRLNALEEQQWSAAIDLGEAKIGYLDRRRLNVVEPDISPSKDYAIGREGMHFLPAGGRQRREGMPASHGDRVGGGNDGLITKGAVEV